MRIPRLLSRGPLGVRRLPVASPGRPRPGCLVQVIEAAAVMAVGGVGSVVMALLYALAAAVPVMVGAGVLHHLVPAVPALSFASTYWLLVAARLALAMVNSNVRIGQPAPGSPTSGQAASAEAPT